jgi:hypothetical protein
LKKIVVLLLVVTLLIPLAVMSCGGHSSNADGASFAFITDLHLGYRGKDTYQKLDAIIDTIIKAKDKYKIIGVIVDGDISDTGKKEDFVYAKRALNRLNEVGIPYIPIKGNHDAWECEMPLEANPDDRSKSILLTEEAVSDQYFEEVFWGPDNSKNINLIKKLFGNSWERSNNPINNLESVDHRVYLQNCGFSYGGITFVGLDLVPRDEAVRPGDLRSSFPKLYKQTLEFSLGYTKNHQATSKTVILFCHYPLSDLYDSRTFVYIQNDVKTNQDAYNIYLFAGHTHGTRTLDKQITTEDTAGINLLLTGIRQNKPIRIVKIGKDGSVDYSTLLAREMIAGEIVGKAREALNGVHSFQFELDCGKGIPIPVDMPLISSVLVKKATGNVVLPNSISIDISARVVLPTKISLIGVDNKLYIQNSFINNGQWSILNRQGNESFDLLNPVAFMSDEILSDIINPTKVAEETIGDIPCFHIQGKISSSVIETATGLSLPGGMREINLWIGKDDFHIYQLSLTGKLVESEDTDNVKTITLSDYNCTVVINAPVSK